MLSESRPGGEKNCRCCEGEGALITEREREGRRDGGRERERQTDRETERENAVHRGLHMKNFSPQPLTGRRREAIISFYKQWSSKSKVLEIHAIGGVIPGRLSGAPVGKEERGENTTNTTEIQTILREY